MIGRLEKQSFQGQVPKWNVGTNSTADGGIAMIRMQVQFTESQAQALKQRAARERVSVSVLVRRAVDGLTAPEPTAADQAARQRAITAAGRFASGHADVAERHDDYLADASAGDGAAMIFVDTSELYAVLDRDAAAHPAARGTWTQCYDAPKHQPPPFEPGRLQQLPGHAAARCQRSLYFRQAFLRTGLSGPGLSGPVP